MERTLISKRIGLIVSDIDKLKSTLAAIENTDISKHPENYNMLTTDAALRSELIACITVWITTVLNGSFYLTLSCVAIWI